MRKFWAFIKIFQQGLYSHRGDLVIWTLSGAITPLVSLAVWLTVQANNPNLILSKNELISYFLLVYLVQVLTAAWGGWFLIEEIRNGEFSKYLLKPHSLLYYWAAENISEKFFKLVVLVISLFFLSKIFLLNVYNIDLNWLTLSIFILAVLLGGSIAFLFDVAIALLSFWIYNSYFIRNFYYSLNSIFSGWIIPIVLLPKLLADTSIYLPFRYIISFPIEIIMGKLTGPDLILGLVIQISWFLIAYMLYKFIFALGIKNHQGYGI